MFKQISFRIGIDKKGNLAIREQKDDDLNPYRDMYICLTEEQAKLLGVKEDGKFDFTSVHNFIKETVIASFQFGVQCAREKLKELPA